MITKKHAYVNITNMDYTMRNVLEDLIANRNITAYNRLVEIQKDIKELWKPLYSTLTKKQKKELLDGWTPDTSDGDYITVPDPPDWKKWDK